MADVIYVNGVAYDGTDVAVYFGPMLCQWASINWKYAKEKGDGHGPGSLPRGRSYRKKSASGSLTVKESFYQELMQYLAPLGLDVTDLAPFPIIVNYSDKVAEEVPGLGMNRVSGQPSLPHTRVLSFVDITDAEHDIPTDGDDLGVSMGFIYFPG